MKKLLYSAALVAALGWAAPAPAQRANSTGGNSPHETTSARLNGNVMVTVTYGRPLAKGRKIWGELVPWDKAWRLGSDEATTMIAQQPLAFGDLTVPAGAYTLYMVPSQGGTSKLAISTAIGAWGIPVDEKHDLGRVDLKKEALTAPVEQLTIAVKRAGNGGQLVISWGDAQYTADFTIKK